MALRYRKVFSNHNVQLDVATDSPKILSLISRFLDFSTRPSPTAKIKIKFEISECSENELLAHRQARYHETWRRGTLVMSAISTDMAETRIDYKTRTVHVTVIDYREPFKESLLDFIFFKPIKKILAQNGFYPLHASMVSKNDSCILICGPANTGKSTLAFKFAKKDFKIVCDDDCFIRSMGSQIELLPFETKMGLKDHVLKANGKVRSEVIKNFRYGGKQRVSWRHSYPASKKFYKDIVLLLPRYSEREKFSIKKLANEKAVALLTKHGLDIWLKVNAPGEYTKNFFALCELAQKSHCYQLIYNDKNAERILAELPMKR